MAEVADLNNAMALPGPLEILRRDCSLKRAFSMLFFDKGLTGRFAAAPGFVLGLLEEGLALGFGGAMMTGPPSLRLMESQISGNRAAKLVMLAK